MRFGAKAAHCRDGVKLNAHVTARFTGNNDQRPELTEDNNISDAGKGFTAGLSCGITGKYVLKNAALGARIGYTWSTSEDAKPIAQVSLKLESKFIKRRRACTFLSKINDSFSCWWTQPTRTEISGRDSVRELAPCFISIKIRRIALLGVLSCRNYPSPQFSMTWG